VKLSPHFTLAELTASDTAARRGWDNTPNEAEIQNLTRLAQLLEMVRDVVLQPLIINSGFRSKQVNDAIGSRDTSQQG
jgi:zinc D-Ala-D-Ala carboxypeptidase